jgi:hypothetical protein
VAGVFSSACRISFSTLIEQLEKAEDFIAFVAASDECSKRVRLKAQITLFEVRGMESHFENAKRKVVSIEP